MSEKGIVASNAPSPDATERKWDEEALRQSEEKFRIIFENANDSIIYLDKYGRIIDINRSTEDIFGYKREEVQGKSFTKLGIFSLKDLPRMARLFADAFRSVPIHLMELEIKRKDGSTVMIEASTELVRKDGKVEGMLVVARGITERKQAEEALREGRNRYRTLLESLPQKIFLKDNNLVYVLCNENFARDLKIKPEKVVGKSDYDFFPKELAEKYRADDRRIMKSGQIESIEEKYIQDGQERIVQTFKTPVRDEEARVIGILGIFHDITERKRMEEEMRSFNELAVGREFRMIELKKEINIVLRKLGEEPRYKIVEGNKTKLNK